LKILVTGSDGLIGGEAVAYFDREGHVVVGADNNMRRQFFGEAGDTLWNRARIFHKASNYIPTDTDIRSRDALWSLFSDHGPFDVVIHCAAQPSHDKAREIPLIDFDVNALGTMNLLERTRLSCPDAVFIFMSTNKVYGDAPNEMPLVEMETRFDYARAQDADGVDENCRIDRSTHSIMGASKVAADVMVQEYGRCFGMKTCVLRGGCLTGPGHSGVELHGFLSYLAKTAIVGRTYKIYGYKGKQVRDNIHSLDVIRAMKEIIENPPRGEVYNIGGGRENSVSVLEAIEKIERLSGKTIAHAYVENARVGDHICYYTNLSKFRTAYPNWRVTKSLDETISEILCHMYWGIETEH
jgi:CDP-paratose 2-epimerase